MKKHLQIIYSFLIIILQKASTSSISISLHFPYPLSRSIINIISTKSILLILPQRLASHLILRIKILYIISIAINQNSILLLYHWN